MKKLVIPIILFVLIISCKKKNEIPASNNVIETEKVDTTGEEKSIITLLKVGAKTTYFAENFFDSDTIVTVVESEIAKDTFVVRNYSDMLSVAPVTYLVKNGNTLYFSYRMRDPKSYSVLCKFDMPVGTQWNVYSGPKFAYSATIDSINVTYSSPYGVIKDVVKVKMVSASNSVSYQYFSPSVGILGFSRTNLEILDHVNGVKALNPPIKIPAITFGSIDFMKTGNSWDYSFENGEELITTIVSKSTSNIYSVLNEFKVENKKVNEYWFEDNGLLMIYEEGETYINADPVYVVNSKAVVGQGWVGTTKTGSRYSYKVSSLDETIYNDKYGEIKALEITVSSGIFPQTNYWSHQKGLIQGLTIGYGFSVTESNVRTIQMENVILPGLFL